MELLSELWCRYEGGIKDDKRRKPALDRPRDTDLGK